MHVHITSGTGSCVYVLENIHVYKFYYILNMVGYAMGSISSSNVIDILANLCVKRT